ncbi:putative ribonuclease H-like domain-containing protein [Tanacetum coccineum]|uniref:Ribonuclease H-like domain-containing protein n=1 Tax=Tanacetum coccineum TaxID=301880 RepID=A0ABQ5IJ76_9ASTR
MTENIAYLLDFKEFDRGYVAFRGGAYGGRITVSHRCVTNRTMSDESMLWHKRLGHINFKNINKLVKDNLVIGKFDGKSDEGFFVGYSLSGKAFRVYTTRTKRVRRILAILGTSEVNSQECIVMPIWKDPLYFDSPTENVENGEPKTADDTQKQDEDGLNNENAKQERFLVDSSSKDVNAAGQQVNTASLDLNTGSLELNAVGPSVSTASPNEEDSTEEEPKVDLENITNSYIVPTTPNTRIHKDHPIDNVIGDVQSTVQTRRMLKPTSEQGFLSDVYEQKTHDTLNTCLYACFLSQIEPTSIAKALSDSSWVEAMQEELLQFKLQQVWILVDLPNGKKAIRTKWVFRNKKVKGNSVLGLKASFQAMLSIMGFLVYQMDLKSAFLYETIEEEVYVTQPLGFKDPNHPDKVYKVGPSPKWVDQAPSSRQKEDILLVQVYVDDIIFGSTNKELCTGFEKLMKDKFQMSSMGELTFFLGLQVQQKEDGIFISQDKYVAKILKKFNYSDVNRVNPVVWKNLLVRMENSDDVMMHYVHVARFQVTPKTSHLLAVKRIFRYLKGKPTLGLWYSRDSPFELVAYTDSDYAGATLDRKSTTGGYLLTKGFDAVLDDVEMPVEAKSIPTTNEEITLAQTLIQIKEAKPKVVTIAATTTTTRPKDKWVVVQEPSEFRVPQEIKPLVSKDKGKENKEKKEEGREEIAKGSRKKMIGRKRAVKEQQEESSKKQKVEEEKELKEVEEDDKVELKKLLIENTWKLFGDSEGKVMVIQGPNDELKEDQVTTWKLIDSSGFHFVRFDNLHIFMLVERRYPLTPITITNMLNKKLQTDHQNEMCYQLLKLMVKQRKGNERGGLFGLKRLHGLLEVTAAQCCWWKDYDCLKTFYYQEDKDGFKEIRYCGLGSTLLVELINERKRKFAQQRAEQRRNKPMTQAQQRTYMCNYIKNMGSHTLQQLKKLSFDEVKELFETTMKRVNIFTQMKSDDTVPKVIVGSSKRDTEQELNHGCSKRQKIGEGSEPAKESKDKFSQEQLQQLMIIVPEEGMNVEALQTKYPIIDWEVYTKDLRNY